MKDFKFPKSITINLPNLEEKWLSENPLLISIRSFAKNKIKDGKLWGGYDHHLEMIPLQHKTTVLTGDFLKNYDSIYRDLSAMEIRPIEFHYSLVEIELMKDEALNNWAKYLEQSKNHFPYEKVLGYTNKLLDQVRNCGNSLVGYRAPFHRIRDLWESELEEKEYKFEFHRKK